MVVPAEHHTRIRQSTRRLSTRCVFFERLRARHTLPLVAHTHNHCISPLEQCDRTHHLYRKEIAKQRPGGGHVLSGQRALFTTPSAMPQAEQQQPQQQPQHSRRRRRRRGGLEASFGQLLPVAAVALCSMTNAFVPQPSWHSVGHGPSPPRATSSSDLPDATMQRGAVASGVRMVLGESPSAACRRALQRAWQASSEEATTHEHLEVRLDFHTEKKKIFDSTRRSSSL